MLTIFTDWIFLAYQYNTMLLWKLKYVYRMFPFMYMVQRHEKEQMLMLTSTTKLQIQLCNTTFPFLVSSICKKNSDISVDPYLGYTLRNSQWILKYIYVLFILLKNVPYLNFLTWYLCLLETSSTDNKLLMYKHT